MRRIVVGLACVIFGAMGPSQAGAQFPPAPGSGPGLPETIEAIDNARVTTRILYVTAHPDDESSAVLTYLARGLHAEVALLSLTRGEGGQNDLGPEQAPQLGLIRTQELLAATRGYGVKLFFANARDFGFSKTPEETEKIWGDAVLRDMVEVIRAFRPNIVINNFGGVHGGHGHHQAAGLWTPKAVQLAADPKAYPDTAREAGLGTALTPWDGGGLPVQVLDVERGPEKPNGYVLPVDEISPLYGKSYRAIGTDAFSSHRTQGVPAFLNSPFFRRPVALIAESGASVDPASLATPLQAWATRTAETCRAQNEHSCAFLVAADADKKMAEARAAALALNWSGAAEALAAAAKLLAEVAPGNKAGAHGVLPPDQLYVLQQTKAHVERALQLAAGLEVTADADRGELVAGETFSLATAAQCRPETECKFGDLRVVERGNSEAKLEKDAAKAGQFKILATKPVGGADAFEQLLPEPSALYEVQQDVTIAGYAFTVKQPVTHVAASSTRVERLALRIVPAYTLAIEPKQDIENLASPTKPLDVLLRVHSYATEQGKVDVGLELPQGWTSSAATELKFSGAGDRYAKVMVTPPARIEAGDYRLVAYAQRGEEKFTESLEPLPSMPTLVWDEPAQCSVHAFRINVPPKLRVGYITAESEPIPEAVRRLGIQVDLLDAAALAFGDLAQYDAIVVGVRAYELRPDLTGANQRLLDYASQGGTMIVQYQRDFAWDRFQYAPYPAKISGAPGNHLPRITDENSPVKFLKPDDALLNEPNKITQADFQGWVQERGLYFWTQFDAKYTPVLAMNDPGEPELDGALVYTHYGRGMYIYTGIAFFRQLPEGVPGAYRLFLNLLSASRESRAPLRAD